MSTKREEKTEIKDQDVFPVVLCNLQPLLLWKDEQQECVGQ